MDFLIEIPNSTSIMFKFSFCIFRKVNRHGVQHKPKF